MNKKIITIVAVVAVVGIAVAGTAFKIASAREASVGSIPTFTVEKKALTISITESGTIKARDLEIIKSQLEGNSTILWVIAEATHVKEGDVLVELDASQLQDAKIDQETMVQNSETAAITAREALAVGENQAEADIDLAQLALDFAKLDLDKYMADKGEYENLKTEAEASVSLAEEELTRAEDKLKWSKKLAAEKYISSTELKTDELAYNRADLNVTLAKNSLQLLSDFTHKRQVIQLNSDVKQAEMALERTNRSSAASVIKLEAEDTAAKSKLEREKIKLAKFEDQIAKATILAPADGMVVYASSAKGSWRGNQEPLEEGQNVHEREELIYLPTSDSVKAEIKVHESSMEKVREGLPVIVTVDALQGRTFMGKVEKIALMPDAQSMWMNPDLKIYATEIFLEGDSEGLRTGMSCKAEIIVDHYEDALQIPIQCVVRIGKQQTVYVRKGREFVKRDVEIGLDNNSRVHVKSGLEVGELVSMAPPLAPGGMDRSREMDMRDFEIPDDVGTGRMPGGPGSASGRPRPGGGAGGMGPGGGATRPGGGAGGRNPGGGGSGRPAGGGGGRPGGSTPRRGSGGAR